jgi:class 3 adenylate cyclase
MYSFIVQSRMWRTRNSASKTLSIAEQEKPSQRSEREFVWILFADLAGIAGFVEWVEGERVQEIHSGFLALATTLIGDHLGSLERAGSGLLHATAWIEAAFDVPGFALRAALDLIESVPDLDPALRARADVRTGELIAEA